MTFLGSFQPLEFFQKDPLYMTIVSCSNNQLIIHFFSKQKYFSELAQFLKCYVHFSQRGLKNWSNNQIKYLELEFIWGINDEARFDSLCIFPPNLIEWLEVPQIFWTLKNLSLLLCALVVNKATKSSVMSTPCNADTLALTIESLFLALQQ